MLEVNLYMIFKIGGQFRVQDYFVKNNNLNIITNVRPDFNILRQCGSLQINKAADGLMKTAKLVTVVPKSDEFLYIRNRAISAGNVIDQPDGSAILIPMDDFYKQFERYALKVRGANDNGDFFPHEELLKSYKTFIGKAVFVDHDNENVEKARGIILDAVYNQRGKFVELLKAVDKKAYPELARAIEMSYVTSTSMGCRCGYSICSICHNKSHTEEDFCEHVQHYKGSTFNGLPVWEVNYDVAFIEDSMVASPADPHALVMEKIAHSVNKSADNFANKTESHVINSKKNNISIMRLQNEQNQRTFSGQVHSIFDKLNELLWS